MFPEDLGPLIATELYDLLDAVDIHGKRYGRGRNEGAAYVRGFCKSERARIRAELRRRGEPTSRPGDERCYGPGQCAWQRAGG